MISISTLEHDSKFQCLIENCFHIWTTDAASILTQDKGCAKCYGNIPLTNKIIDEKLLARNIQRLDDYINNHTHIRWQCLNKICNNIWTARPSHILSSKSGCPNCCATRPLLEASIIDARLVSHSIERIGNYTGICVETTFLCLNKLCNFVWETTPNNILNCKRGCPKCSGLHKNENIVFNILLQTSFIIKKQYSIKKIIHDEIRTMRVDFYLPEIQTIIEYNGEQHYKPVRFNKITLEQAEINFVKQQARDQYLQFICDTNNIKLICIDGRKYTNSKLEKYIIEFIIPIL